MSDTVIKVENLSKRYLIGHKQKERERYIALRDVLVREARQIGRKAVDLMRGRLIVQAEEIEEFWALKDVSFEVKRGEVLGIIGRNGAGKSTLLKILSRITEPTEGRVEMRGRVASLLEVGTGFHPELTGRENIFLNGAVLGMKKAEVRKKFDEIVDFAGVEQFLDTPVKRYSSGMYVRLAFSIAAHLEPEILIVDEVLAVGDAEFQKKCLGRLDKAAHGEGRTVLIVSHDLNAVKTLAQSGLLLAKGGLANEGRIEKVVAAYLNEKTGETVYTCPLNKKSQDHPYVEKIEIITSHNNNIHEAGQPLSVNIKINNSSPLKQACFSLQILNQYTHPVIHAEAYYPEYCFADRPGHTHLTCIFPHLRLNVGRYYIIARLTGPPVSGTPYEVLDRACEFEVQRTDKLVPWGWRPEIRSYFEDFEWVVKSTTC